MVDYRRLSLVAKQAHQRASMREGGVPCPECETVTTSADLIAHMATMCPGRREPDERSRWIGWRDAVQLGVPKQTLSFWVLRGDVRFKGPIQGRQYLLKDIAVRRAEQLRRRRKSGKLDR